MAITSFTCVQTSTGAKTARCVIKGDPYTIYTISAYNYGQWWDKATGTIPDSGTATTTISFDSIGRSFDVKCEDGIDSIETTVYMAEAPSRPDNWYWTQCDPSYGKAVTVINGNAKYISATEWNQFIARIAEFYTYKGKTLPASTIASLRVSSGSRMNYSTISLARNVILSLNPRISPKMSSSGSPITAELINSLATSLNSVS